MRSQNGTFWDKFLFFGTVLSFFPWVWTQKFPLPVAKIATGVRPDFQEPANRNFEE
jgi:hypothetical protein